MIRNLVSVLLLIGFASALLALPPAPADARWYKKHYASKHTKHWARHRKSARLHHKRRFAAPRPPPTPPSFKVLTRDEILTSDPGRLERLGHRLIVGFENFDAVKTLVEKRAVAGIFITDHNVRGRKTADVAEEIRSLQDIRKAQGLPRLIVAADQEGGYVSRLSPPLKWQPSLGMLIAKLKTDTDREKAVRDYAETQANELERLGITMNFGPVVDLRLGSSDRDDGETRLYWRAIASDPYLVAKVAGWYCDTLTKYNIICTLKHFPGLGRVKRDTHVVSGEISAGEAQLELSDWVPFHRNMDQPGVATMIGHVRIDAIDATTPASYSSAVINSIIRSRWHCDGLLITDDLGMGAVMRSKDGLGGAAVKALNAGVDLLLLSSADDYFDTVMSALIDADSTGAINQARQIESRERMSKYVFIDDSPPSASAPVQAQQQQPQRQRPN